MAFACLKDISARASDDQVNRHKQMQSKKLCESELFKKTMGAFEAARHMPTGPFQAHPKMDKTVNILVQYYGGKHPDSDSENSGEGVNESKAMVFVTHREVVDEIVMALDEHKPLIRASKFIGQGATKQGKKGQAQKEQLEVCSFHFGTDFHVLSALL